RTPSLSFSLLRPPPPSTLFPYTTLFRSLNPRGDGFHTSPLLLHLLEEPAAPSPAQHRSQHPDRQVLGMKQGHRAEPHEKVRPFHVPAQQAKARILLRWLRGGGGGRTCSGREISQESIDFLYCPPG